MESFLTDERFELENKIQNLRLKERQQILNKKKKDKLGLTNSFHELNKTGSGFHNSMYAPSKITHTRQNFMLKTGDVSLSKNNEGLLNELEPSTVNDKIPSKYVIDYPNFLKPAKYYPYRKLEEHHIADVITEARKRHEEKLMKTKAEEIKFTDMFFKNIEESKKKMQNVEHNRKKLYEDHKKCLQEQIMQKRLLTAYESAERRRYVKTHFGPEETEERVKMHSDKIYQEKDYIKDALLQQIEEKRSTFINRSKKERAEDQKALEIIAQIR